MGNAGNPKWVYILDFMNKEFHCFHHFVRGALPVKGQSLKYREYNSYNKCVVFCLLMDKWQFIEFLLNELSSRNTFIKRVKYHGFYMHSIRKSICQ